MAKTKEESISPAALQQAINKRFGPETMRMGDDPSLEVKRIPSGILSIDYLLHGGFARGRHTELYGSPSIGKTSLAYRLIASAQSQGLLCSFIDVEQTYDSRFAAHLGVDTKKLYTPPIEQANQAVDIIETLLRSRLYSVIVMDSIAALLPKSELESDMEAGSMGMEQAKLMSKALRKLTAANKDTVLLYINQVRSNVGGSIFAKKDITSGGRAMGFYAGTRLELSQIEKIKIKETIIDHKGEEKQADVVVGHRVRVLTAKEKTSSALTGDQTTFVFSYRSKNIDPIEDLLYLGRKEGFIKKKGDYWYVQKEKKFSGRARFKRYLENTPKLQAALEKKIRERIESQNI